VHVWDNVCICIWIYLPHERKHMTFIFLNLTYMMFPCSTDLPANYKFSFYFMAE
jgi:hypothetical protein